MITQETRAAARRWVVRLSDDSSAAARSEFERWLHQSPDNALAYQKASGIWRAVGEMHHLEPLAQPRRSWIRPFAIAASIGIVSVIVILWVTRTDEPLQRYSTAVAQVSDLTLPDRSVVTVGARSSIDVQFTARERRVLLESGEAIFDVARDPARPFVVEAETVRVRALGTRFEVHRGAAGIRVVVFEGAVQVEQASGALQRISAGQQVTTDGRGEIETTRAVSHAETASWPSGILRYQDASLAEVIADANRYYDGQIVIASADLATLRVTASFGSDQVAQFIDSLPGVLPLRVDRTTPGRITIHPAEH